MQRRLLGLLVVVALGVAAAQLAPAGVVPEPPSAELSIAQQTALRLRKVWTGGDVSVIGRADALAVPVQEEASDLLNRFNDKYGVYDRYFDAVQQVTKPRSDLPDPSTLPSAPPGFTEEQEDYKSVYHNANKKDFDPTKDNPDNLENMLGSLWGKRYAHMSAAARDDALRAEKVLIIKGTSAESERMSQGISTDGSVQSWVAHAEAVEDTPVAPPADAPFKPESFWYGPRVIQEALDVTKEAVDASGKPLSRTPSAPPKPPVDSYIFAEQPPAGAEDPATKVTIIESITVTKPTTPGAQPREPTFEPIMTKDALVAPHAAVIVP